MKTGVFFDKCGIAVLRIQLGAAAAFFLMDVAKLLRTIYEVCEVLPMHKFTNFYKVKLDIFTNSINYFSVRYRYIQTKMPFFLL